MNAVGHGLLILGLVLWLALGHFLLGLILLIVGVVLLVVPYARL